MDSYCNPNLQKIVNQVPQCGRALLSYLAHGSGEVNLFLIKAARVVLATIIVYSGIGDPLPSHYMWAHKGSTTPDWVTIVAESEQVI